MEARSSSVIPGHINLQSGLYRTDAPATTQLPMITVATITMILRFDIETIDVQIVFLSEMALARELSSSLSEGWRAVKFHALLKTLKETYEITEAPRSWYLRTRELSIDIHVFIELKRARAVFILRQDEKLVALLTLHVDDDMMFGDIASKKMINKYYKIKEWKPKDFEKDVDYTDMQRIFVLENDKRTLVVHRNKYIHEFGFMQMNKKEVDEGDLTSSEMTEFKSYLAKARWQIAKLIPEVVYGISALAQGDPIKKVVHVKVLNETIGHVYAMRDTGLARLRIVPINLEDVALVTVMDARFANEPGRKSLLDLTTTTAIKQGAVHCNSTEF